MKIHDLAIVGAGPVGLEAAARAADAGLDVVVLEAGDIADHVRRWGAVRLFSAFGLNVGPAGAAAVEGAGETLPGPAEILTGSQFRDRYLLPLAEALAARIDLRTGTRVYDMARDGWLKGEALGSPTRAEQPLRLLTRSAGAEEAIRAWSVFDCSGTYGQPNWAGPGGAPALGERGAEGIVRHVPDPLGRDQETYAGDRTLLLGGGHSAATLAVALAELADRAPGTRFTWACRRPDAEPLARIADDPLPERDRLAREANAIAADPPEGSEWLGGATLLELASEGSRFAVRLSVGGSEREETFDRVVALVGYEPDERMYRQLQVHECYASRGPMKLAAALLAASGDGPADCLDQGGFGPDTLENPEPGFFILGAKSYGKNSAFLMRTGYEQVADAFSNLLAGATTG